MSFHPAIPENCGSPQFALEVSPLMIDIFKNSHNRYGVWANSDDIIRRHEEANGLGTTGPGSLLCWRMTRLGKRAITRCRANAVTYRCNFDVGQTWMQKYITLCRAVPLILISFLIAALPANRAMALDFKMQHYSDILFKNLSRYCIEGRPSAEMLKADGLVLNRDGVWEGPAILVSVGDPIVPGSRYHCIVTTVYKDASPKAMLRYLYPIFLKDNLQGLFQEDPHRQIVWKESKLNPVFEIRDKVSGKLVMDGAIIPSNPRELALIGGLLVNIH
ncbi:MAG: hypothetical protein H6888_13810 [Nitratireductor sp.]|nr:hypothetical protein [Nitratireductor sp.]